jgi:transcriptional regulator PpsR
VTPLNAPERYLGGLDSETTGQLLASTNDISLVVDDEGVILDAGFGDLSTLDEALGDIVGRDWLDTVTPDSRAKIHDLLAITPETAPSRWRQVNHPGDDDVDVPVSYRALTRDGDGRLIVVGRDMRPTFELQQQLLDVQHSMERDYARLHQAETRYRMLFTLAAEGILIVDAHSRRVVEANPAAGRLFERPVGKLVGSAFPVGFDEPGAALVEEHLAQVKAAGNADEIHPHLSLDSGAMVRLRATLLRREDGLFFLVRLSPFEGGGGEDSLHHPLIEVVRRSPDAFVVTNPKGEVLAANQAFMQLAEVGSEMQVRGQPLDRWIGRSGVDFELLRKNLSKRTQLRQFVTTLRPEYGDPIDIELSGVAALDAKQPCLGFVIRRSSRETESRAPKPDEPLAGSIQDMTELIGRVPLKDLVRETSDIIERLCIEAALKTTQGNRASAAELLGLSRQSLYVKLRRYGLSDFEAGEDD